MVQMRSYSVGLRAGISKGDPPADGRAKDAKNPKTPPDGLGRNEELENQVDPRRL